MLYITIHAHIQYMCILSSATSNAGTVLSDPFCIRLVMVDALVMDPFNSLPPSRVWPQW